MPKHALPKIQTNHYAADGRIVLCLSEYKKWNYF